jgi:hypothetical protein
MNISVNQYYRFREDPLFSHISEDLTTVCSLIANKTLGKVLKQCPATIEFGDVPGSSKARYLKTKSDLKIILDKKKLESDHGLILRNIVLESCNIVFIGKRKRLLKKIFEKNAPITKEDLTNLEMGTISDKDIKELNRQISKIRKLDLGSDAQAAKIKSLAYETAEYYSMKYFDSICDFLKDSGITIKKKNFKSLQQYLKTQQGSGHSALYTQ